MTWKRLELSLQPKTILDRSGSGHDVYEARYQGRHIAREHLPDRKNAYMSRSLNVKPDWMR